MTYTHTPGPWRIYEDGMIGSASVRRFPDMTVLQPGTVKGETIGVAMANARLIAAAPLLLHALKDVLDRDDIDSILATPVLKQARAAIKAATTT